MTQISVFGQTDKRAVIYTLLKLLYPMGRVCFITNDRWALRLMDGESTAEGSFNNIDICVTDATADEMWGEVSGAPSDYDYVVLDNLYNEQTTAIIYVMGWGVDEADQFILDSFTEEERATIKLGAPVQGKKYPTIPYSVDAIKNIERSEFYHKLYPISESATKAVTAAMAPVLNMPQKSLIKVVNRK